MNELSLEERIRWIDKYDFSEPTTVRGFGNTSIALVLYSLFIYNIGILMPCTEKN